MCQLRAKNQNMMVSGHLGGLIKPLPCTEDADRASYSNTGMLSSKDGTIRKKPRKQIRTVVHAHPIVCEVALHRKSVAVLA